MNLTTTATTADKYELQARTIQDRILAAASDLTDEQYDTYRAEALAIREKYSASTAVNHLRKLAVQAERASEQARLAVARAEIEAEMAATGADAETAAIAVMTGNAAAPAEAAQAEYDNEDADALLAALDASAEGDHAPLREVLAADAAGQPLKKAGKGKTQRVAPVAVKAVAKKATARDTSVAYDLYQRDAKGKVVRHEAFTAICPCQRRAQQWARELKAEGKVLKGGAVAGGYTWDGGSLTYEPTRADDGE